jgi:plasmid stability protein
MEAEVRFILADAVSPAEQTLFDLLLQARERTGGVDLDPFLPARDEPHRDPLV